MLSTDDLLSAIFDASTAPLYADFEGWVRESRRFKAFATNYRGKIRAKLKNARGDEGRKDVRAELETAALLMRDDRFKLEYETYAAIKVRGPDFTVTFRANTFFNVEVRRIRSVELEDGDSEDARTAKLMAVLCDKVGQMPPGIINLLWLVAERELSEADLIRAAVTLRQLAEGKDEDFFKRRGFESAADFLKLYRQLSGIVLHRADGNLMWLNSLARYAVPPPIVTAIQNLKTD
jgi:hypothetical protein